LRDISKRSTGLARSTGLVEQAFRDLFAFFPSIYYKFSFIFFLFGSTCQSLLTPFFSGHIEPHIFPFPYHFPLSSPPTSRVPLRQNSGRTRCPVCLLAPKGVMRIPNSTVQIYQSHPNHIALVTLLL